MNKYIENVVIGKPLIEPSDIFALNDNNWNEIESKQTYYTNERFLPRILVDLEIYPSINEIRRNKPELMITLDKMNYIELKVKKKRKLYILIGK